MIGFQCKTSKQKPHVKMFCRYTCYVLSTLIFNVLIINVIKDNKDL